MPRIIHCIVCLVVSAAASATYSSTETEQVRGGTTLMRKESPPHVNNRRESNSREDLHESQTGFAHSLGESVGVDVLLHANELSAAYDPALYQKAHHKKHKDRARGRLMHKSHGHHQSSPHASKALKEAQAPSHKQALNEKILQKHVHLQRGLHGQAHSHADNSKVTSQAHGSHQLPSKTKATMQQERAQPKESKHIRASHKRAHGKHHSEKHLAKHHAQARAAKHADTKPPLGHGASSLIELGTYPDPEKHQGGATEIDSQADTSSLERSSGGEKSKPASVIEEVASDFASLGLTDSEIDPDKNFKLHRREAFQVKVTGPSGHEMCLSEVHHGYSVRAVQCSSAHGQHWYWHGSHLKTLSSDERCLGYGNAASVEKENEQAHQLAMYPCVGLDVQSMYTAWKMDPQGRLKSLHTEHCLAFDEDGGHLNAITLPCDEQKQEKLPTS
jgi:hypothetical protein